MNGAVNDRVVSSTGSSMRRRTHASTQAAASPIATPPSEATRKSVPTAATVTLPVMAVIAADSVTSAVASLTRLSPSRIVTIRRGMPTFRAMEVAATASGGATTAPRAIAAANEIDGTISHVTKPTAKVHASTKPTESHIRASLVEAKSISEVRIAAAYSRGGSSPTSTSSGSSSNDGTPGTNEATMPISTRRSGGDQPSRRDAPAANATVTTTPRTRRALSTAAMMTIGPTHAPRPVPSVPAMRRRPVAV